MNAVFKLWIAAAAAVCATCTHVLPRIYKTPLGELDVPLPEPAPQRRFRQENGPRPTWPETRVGTAPQTRWVVCEVPPSPSAVPCMPGDPTCGGVSFGPRRPVHGTIGKGCHEVDPPGEVPWRCGNESQSERAASKAALEKMQRDLLLRQTEHRALLLALREDGARLANIGFEFFGDRQRAATAVANRGDALRFAAPDLRADLAIARIAVAQDPDAIRHVDASLADDPDLVRMVLWQEPAQLRNHRAWALLIDRPTAIAMVEQDGGAYCFLSEALRDDAWVRMAVGRIEAQWLDPTKPEDLAAPEAPCVARLEHARAQNEGAAW